MSRPVNRTEWVSVSPRMIEAGLRAMEVWKELPRGERLAEVYRAMAAVAPIDRSHMSDPSPTIIEMLKRFGRK
jgi:hypothetical protein